MPKSGGTKVAALQHHSKFKNAPLEPTPEIMSLWKSVHKQTRTEFGEAIYRSWLKPLKLQASYHGTMEIAVPTRFMRDWIQTHYAQRILEMFQESDDTIKKVQFVVCHSAPLDDEPEPEIRIVKEANQNIKNAIADIGSPLDQRFKFENFVVGKSNALAHAASRRVVESQTIPFNPLFIYGGVGLGEKPTLCTPLPMRWRNTGLKKQ